MHEHMSCGHMSVRRPNQPIFSCIIGPYTCIYLAVFVRLRSGLPPPQTNLHDLRLSCGQCNTRVFNGSSLDFKFWDCVPFHIILWYARLLLAHP